MGIVKKFNVRRVLSFTALIIGSAAIALTYQNCSAPPPGEVGPASTSFPYESKIDHIAYMSCSNMASGYNNNALFTFKAGAYDANSGIRLSPTYANNTLNLTVSDLVNTLVTDESSSDAYLGLSLRSSTNYLSYFTGGYLFSNMFMGNIISAPGPAGELANIRRTPNYINQFTSLSGARVESTIHFTNNETLANEVRTNIGNGSALLSLTYNKAGDNDYSPIGSGATSVIGTGYRANFGLGFGQTSAFVGTSGPTRIMYNVQEVDLNTRSNTSSAWDCPPEWTFMIVKPADLGVRAFCEISATTTTPVTATQTAMRDAIRKVLSADHWDVNLRSRCLVPRATTASCYGNSAALVNYTGGTCDMNAGTCPHYVSICKRR